MGSTSQHHKTLDLQPAEELEIDDNFHELAFLLYYHLVRDSILDRQEMEIPKIADLFLSQDFLMMFLFCVWVWKYES